MPHRARRWCFSVLVLAVVAACPAYGRPPARIVVEHRHLRGWHHRRLGTTPARLSLSSAPSQYDITTSGAIDVTVHGLADGPLRIVPVAYPPRADPTTSPGVALGDAQLVPVTSGTTLPVRLGLSPAGRETIGACVPHELVIEAIAAPRAYRSVARTIAVVWPQAPACGGFFAPGGVWNAPLLPDAALDPNSSAIVSELGRQVQQGGQNGFPPTINTSRYSTPVYTVGADQKRVHVTLDVPAGEEPELRQAIDQVPIPDGARPAAGTDAQLTVWQPATDTMWEFWRLREASDGWHAAWAGRIIGVSNDPGYYTGAQANWGATATDLPLLGGLITLADLRRGHIDHAVSFAVNAARAGVWAWPAQHSDGGAQGSNTVPEGARFRLDPTVDVGSLGLPPLVRMIAEAAQRYGMIVRDTGGSISFYGEDPGPTGADPYPALLAGLAPWDALRGFPWNRLQLLRMQLATSADGGPPPGPLGGPLPLSLAIAGH